MPFCARMLRYQIGARFYNLIFLIEATYSIAQIINSDCNLTAR